MSKYSIINYSKKYENSYSNFIDDNYGTNSYLKSSNYLQWLYFDNPSGIGYQDFLLVTTEKSIVVGCIHKLRFEINTNSSCSTESGVTIHNLMIDKLHRNGIALMLVVASLKKEKIFFAPAVLGKLNFIYKNLNTKSYESYWGYKLIYTNFINYISHHILNNKIYKLPKVNKVTLLKESNDILLLLLNNESRDITFTHEFINWRLFSHHISNNYVLISESGKSCLIFATGWRKNIPVCRIYFSKFLNVEEGSSLFKNALGISKAKGCLLLLLTLDDPISIEVVNNFGIKSIVNKPKSYLRAGNIKIKKTYEWQLFSDIGFEESFS
jgi:hypothetical protein